MFLSAVALAAGVYAADKLEAGTADSPNYYVLKAGCGTPYLAYCDEFLDTPNGVLVRLHRTADLAKANIWAVTPGEAEGTLHITAYGSTRGLMNFVNYYYQHAYATAAEPQDIYPVYQADGTVSLCLNNSTGYDTVDGYCTLDANNGSDFCGNWLPGDAGTNWTAYKIDATNGVEAGLATVKQALNEDLVDQYIGIFNAYIANVPQVAPELNAGIEALNDLEIDVNSAAKISEIYENAISNANTTLNTMLVGKSIAIKNLRRAELGRTSYLAADAKSQTFPMVELLATSPATVFSFEAAEDGYYLYNADQQVYLGDNISTVAKKEYAQTIKLQLNTYGGFTGISMLMPIESNHNALNTSSLEKTTTLVSWSADDAGSIWSLIEASDEAKAKDAIDASVAKLEPYVPALPAMVADILTTAIDQIKALTYSETIATEAEEIANAALASANELLAGGMNDMKLSLMNLRQNKFISIADGEWVYDEYNEAKETIFTFKAQADGGYIIYNEAANIYVGEAETDESVQTNVTVATEEATAQVVYPFLCKGDTYYGVALALEAEPTEATTALNTNNKSTIFHTYRAGDGGSIWSLRFAYNLMAKETIQEHIDTLNTYIANVPWVADDLNAGIEALNNFEIDENFEEKITEIYENIISNANTTLNTMFVGKPIALKNLRRANGGKTAYMSASADTYPMVADYITNAAAVFTLEAAETGYYLYNAATSTYFALTDGAIATTTEKESAQEIKFMLQSNSGFTGVNMLLPDVEGHNALNADQNADTKVVLWNGADGGSIWSIMGASDEDMVNDAIAASVASLEVYVDAVPSMVANILKTAIAEIKALNPSATTAEAVDEIATTAIATANELLATGMNDMELTLKNLRQNKFISINGSSWVYDEYNEAKETVFTFKTQADGGYILYNAAANIYVGEAVTDNFGQTDVTVATEEAAAQVVYPFLRKGGTYYGVALALAADPSEDTTALNTNNNSTIFHTYYANDAGSIFALVTPGTENRVNSVEAVKLQGIVCKVGDSVEVSAVVEPENATDKVLNWSSTNPEVAAVDADGVVWFNAPGSATVTAECQGHEISVPFVVREVIARALNVFPVEAVGGVGHEFSLLALHEPENTTDKSVTWESSDPEVATVSEDGRVSLASLGSAKITARSGDHTAVCAVTVDDTVGLTEMASSGVVIDIVEGGIIVRNAPVGEMIAVYAVDGKAVNGAVVESDETRLNLATGIYIVKVSPSTVAKVLVK